MEHYNSKKLTHSKMYEEMVKFIFSLEIGTIIYNIYGETSNFCEKISEHKALEIINTFMGFDNVILEHIGDHVVFTSSIAKITRVLKVYPRGYNGKGFLFKPEKNKLRKVVKIFGSKNNDVFECRINGINSDGKTKFFLGLGEYTEYSPNVYRYNVIDNNASMEDLKRLVSAKRKEGYKITFSHCTESL